MIGLAVDYYPKTMRDADGDVLEKLPIQGKIEEVGDGRVKISGVWVPNEYWRPTRFKYMWNFYGRSETLYYLTYCGIFTVFLWYG